MIALNISVFPVAAVKVISAGAVFPVNASVGDKELFIVPVIDPVTSQMPTARLRVAPPKTVTSTLGLVKFAFQDLIVPPIAPEIEMFPLIPLTPAIVILL
jgi:hypothetical protein